jgi:hypothetical protein
VNSLYLDIDFSSKQGDMRKLEIKKTSLLKLKYYTTFLAIVPYVKSISSFLVKEGVNLTLPLDVSSHIEKKSFDSSLIDIAVKDNVSSYLYDNFYLNTGELDIDISYYCILKDRVYFFTLVDIGKYNIIQDKSFKYLPINKLHRYLSSFPENVINDIILKVRFRT